MATVALIGASGNVGTRLLKELTARNHTVTGIARHPEKIVKLDGVTPVKGDVHDKESLSALLKGHDAVISAVRFVDTDPAELIQAVKDSGVKRYLVVGGAGSLEVAPGEKVIDQPDFPEEYKAEASKGVDFLEYIKTVDDLDWTFLSPSAVFGPGARTGNFRLGKDQLLATDAGSSISFEDFAIAMVDELEDPAHTGERFTVGY
ncbi:NAD(P)-dependent oxidoreductase [uncultured Pseudodesulfovibrio sp.]|uniref:NAD(P)-dependent oxidoreductase n=1 Tax=uncultured Pseudodesulfovibrio sp. TaxID=2035858 RepID=UPI0029C8A14E|nr:NAD(P)-dependent oxidoreductase [uncultured Pseudodesulfovibrio sp.]